jgi:hypothetical protein
VAEPRPLNDEGTKAAAVAAENKKKLIFTAAAADAINSANQFLKNFSLFKFLTNLFDCLDTEFQII